MASHPSVPLSSKLAMTAAQGFALNQSNEANYRFEWHHHDCAMLLWAQMGALDSRWLDSPYAASTFNIQEAHDLRLVRNTALLLPAHAVHSTRSGTRRRRKLRPSHKTGPRGPSRLSSLSLPAAAPTSPSAHCSPFCRKRWASP